MEKSFDLFNHINAEDCQFSFSDFLRSLVLDNQKAKGYQFANTNLIDYLDVKKYLQLKQEVALLKELILDKKQLLIFNTIYSVYKLKEFV